MKRCSKCGDEKLFEEFCVDRSKKDGREGQCRLCRKQYRLEHVERDKARQKLYHQINGWKKRPYVSVKKPLTPQEIERRAEVAREARRRQRKTKAYKSRRAVRKAIKWGRLKRMPCEVCGEQNTHAHHDDHSKPLEVRFLCRIHHEELHRNLMQAKRDISRL